MYLLMEKQHNRGQDGAGFASIKYDMQPGQRYISRVRSNKAQPIQHIFQKINVRIQEALDEAPQLLEKPDALKQAVPYVGEVMLGHVRYGTFGKNSLESVHPFLRQNNWMHRNLIVAGNFNMTNVYELFQNLVDPGQHPKAQADTVTVMEKIGHFLDDAVAKIYKKLKKEGFDKATASPQIAARLKIHKILKKAAKNWDGGYAMAGLLGHGDSFVLRDPAGIRPTYYYDDDEVVVVASNALLFKRCLIFLLRPFRNCPQEMPLSQKQGGTTIREIIAPLPKKACSFERIYFSRGSDAAIYNERKKLGELLFPSILKGINNDLVNSVFSFIPNTAETSFYGMISAAQIHVKKLLAQALTAAERPNAAEVEQLLLLKPRIEKIAIKDAKLRTFITEDASRDDLVAHVYDITYGVVKPTDNLVIIDDSIVRGTTLKKSILQMLDRLSPKKIIVVSSAPQIRYPDCYGIDMANLHDFIAFQAALALHKDQGDVQSLLDTIYAACKDSLNLPPEEVTNCVKALYAPFTDAMISDKIAALFKTDIKSELQIIFSAHS